MPFLPPNQQHQSTEGTNEDTANAAKKNASINTVYEGAY